MELTLRELAIKLRVRHHVILEIAELAGTSYRYIARTQGVLQLSHDAEFIKAAVDPFRTEHIRFPAPLNKPKGACEALSVVSQGSSPAALRPPRSTRGQPERAEVEESQSTWGHTVEAVRDQALPVHLGVARPEGVANHARSCSRSSTCGGTSETHNRTASGAVTLGIVLAARAHRSPHLARVRLPLSHSQRNFPKHDRFDRCDELGLCSRASTSAAPTFT